MVGIPGIQEIEFWISKLVLSNPSLEFRSISSNETRSLINNVLNKIY